MARMPFTAAVLLLGAAALMVVQSSAAPIAAVAHKSSSKVVDCVAFCAGNDVAARKKKSSSTTLKPNTPDKCGLYATPKGSTPSTCDCGDCSLQYTGRICALNKPFSLTDSSGSCCSCSDTVKSACFCGGTDPKTATFCNNQFQATGNTCLSCKVAVCCEFRSINGPAIPTSIRYSGNGVLANQFDWPNSISPIVAFSAVAGCATGVYSCAGLTNVQCQLMGY